jgi:DUF1680 family protein
VNLYIGGQARIALDNGSEVTLRQTTRYPWDGHVKIEVGVERPAEFTLSVRIPGWAPATRLAVNGSAVSPPVSNGYAHIRHEWSTGSVVELEVPLQIQKLEANPNVLQSRGMIALRRGPLIYCLEQADNTVDLDRISMPLDAKLTEKSDPDLLGGVVVLQGTGRVRPESEWQNQLYRPVRPASTEAVAIKAIPYCVWGNRGRQRMQVWIDSASV